MLKIKMEHPGNTSGLSDSGYTQPLQVHHPFYTIFSLLTHLP